MTNQKHYWELRYFCYYLAGTQNITGNDGVNICIHITGRHNANIICKTAESEQTSNFISEVFRLMEISAKNKNNCDFSWITPYLTSYPPEMETGKSREVDLEQSVRFIF